MPSPPPPARPRIVFTDLDGTLIHYPGHDGCPALDDEDGIITLPPSTTGLRGVISAATLRGLARLRSLPGVHLVIVSGARSSTLDRRLPYLPACDAIAAESGGRLHWAGKLAARGTPVVADLCEDLGWRAVHASTAGPPTQGEATPPGLREGALWDAFRGLRAGGWDPDAAAYATAFRLPLRRDKSAADLAAALASLPPSLQSTSNLGCADVLPATSGKAAVGLHVMRALGADPADCAFLCDDANDLGLAALVGRVFVVRATDPSIAAAAAAEPAKFWQSGCDGPPASEAAVGACLAWAMGV
jgi:hydroxymethylpyrimidine pyrophosphatase-like HAD family hydrolase